MKNPSFFRIIQITLCGFITIHSFSACTTSQQFKAWDPGMATVSKIDSICSLQMETGHFPGLAVAVASGKKLLWTKGYGYASLEKNEPIDPEEDLFRIGSISKSVTASALARLYEKGKINIDLPISTYYKDCPQDKSNLTLRQIAGHLAGIRHYRGLEFLSNIHYTNVTDPLEVFIHDTLLFEPGTQYSYSTYGWTLVSEVMEKAIQKPFTDIVEDEVISPLHLSDLKPDQRDSTTFDRVSFYEFQDSVFKVSPVVDNSNKWAGGGYLCSVEDLAKFGHALAGPGYLKQETITAFTKSQATSGGESTNYGIGFANRTDTSGRNWFGHSGGSVGGTSMLLIYPEQDLVIVTLVNLSGAKMDDLAWRIADVILSENSRK